MSFNCYCFVFLAPPIVADIVNSVMTCKTENTIGTQPACVTRISRKDKCTRRITAWQEVESAFCVVFIVVYPLVLYLFRRRWRYQHLPTNTALRLNLQLSTKVTHATIYIWCPTWHQTAPWPLNPLPKYRNQNDPIQLIKRTRMRSSSKKLISAIQHKRYVMHYVRFSEFLSIYISYKTIAGNRKIRKHSAWNWFYNLSSCCSRQLLFPIVVG